MVITDHGHVPSGDPFIWRLGVQGLSLVRDFPRREVNRQSVCELDRNDYYHMGSLTHPHAAHLHGLPYILS